MTDRHNIYIGNPYSVDIVYRVRIANVYIMSVSHSRGVHGARATGLIFSGPAGQDLGGRGPAAREDAYRALREMVTILEQADTEGDTADGNNSEAASGETSPAHKKARFEDFEDDDDTPAAPVDEVTQYLAMRIPRESTASLLHWWKATEAHLPKLARVARRILAIPASSASSERAFSAAGVTISQRRTALDPETTFFSFIPIS